MTTELVAPIIQSRLDLDHYKLTMGQFVFNRYANVPVNYAFTNRTKRVKLADHIAIGDLRNQLDHIRDLRPTEQELVYLGSLKNNGKKLFSNNYLNFLKNLELPDYSLREKNGELELGFQGPWAKAIYWETFALSVVNELYYKATTPSWKAGEIYAEGNRRLEEKVNLLRENPFVNFLEFGTRRRYSRDWQEKVVAYFKKEIPAQIVGTSNVHLAMKYGLEPKGTMAHELFMVMSGIMHKNDDEIRASHNQVLQEWWNEYGYDLSLALTDTYGSDFFFKDMTLEQARNWKGLRQDSGNPEIFAQKQIQFYQEKNIDARKKVFVPSDGLDVEKIIGLQTEYHGQIIQTAGWGTDATNDLGLAPLSLVVKAVEANGHGTVKLSDNSAKTMGKPEDVARFMKIFEYDPAKYVTQECKF